MANVDIIIGQTQIRFWPITIIDGNQLHKYLIKKRKPFPTTRMDFLLLTCAPEIITVYACMESYNLSSFTLSLGDKFLMYADTVSKLVLEKFFWKRLLN